MKLMRDVAEFDNDSILIEHPIKRAKLEVRRDKKIEELKEFSQDKEVAINSALKLWQNYEEMLFNLSQADKHLSIDDFEKMNVYKFMTYRKLLIKRYNDMNTINNTNG